ncbi:hypothetical protein QJS10_CPB22g00171 [Acorus calamus]|uniref:Uncharacterized protein n=1 Tax=Acorus calamus TaxID=4465 RepID=A0AAV9BYE5_ACOCL|nr:hypothetical protein QJS10_CPB22g00171 [Acorus calamus]
MGCVHSKSIDREETVRRCRDRRRLMKLLLHQRSLFAQAHLDYLRCLRNVGSTLRQFADAADPHLPVADDPLPRWNPPLPPPPPPPPLPFSPGHDDIDGSSDVGTPPAPPPPVPGDWGFLDSFSSDSSPAAEEEWAETNTDFGDGGVAYGDVALKLKLPAPAERDAMVVDDSSSVVSEYTKDSADGAAVVVWGGKRRSLAGIVKEIDEYFLKASAGGAGVAAVLESVREKPVLRRGGSGESDGKSSKSAKVFSVLSWSWSSKSLSSKDLQGTDHSNRPISHCMTLDKLYAKELKLYKDVKEEEFAKLQHKKKTMLLHRLEAGEPDEKIEQTLAIIEELESQIISLQQSINDTCFSISKLRDEELLPQLVDLSSGLMQMWKTMYECHQVQNHIAQQMNHLNNHLIIEPTTEYHRKATTQLETEVTFWSNAFNNLLKCQREYAHTINQWVRLTDCLPNNNSTSLGIHALCEEWQLALDRLPDKVAAEAIKSFNSIIHSIILQQAEEYGLQKKSDRLEKRLEKELNSLTEMEMKFDKDSVQSTNHPLSIKYSKTNTFKKTVEDEKAKYMNSVRESRAMTLNNLQTSLPNVFQALMGFASVFVQALDSIQRPTEAMVDHIVTASPLCT